MNFIHFYWAGKTRKTFPHPTALPPVELLNNLATWSRHLYTTQFLPVLWVNETVFNEIKQNGHAVLNADEKYNEIKNKIPSTWHTSLEILRKKVGVKNLLYWHTRRPNTLNPSFDPFVKIMVANIEGYFTFHTLFNSTLSTCRFLFQLLNKYNLAIYVKDSTSQFIVSLFGGFFFDLDITPEKSCPFYPSIDELKRHAPIERRSALYKYGHIFSLLSESSGDYYTDMGVLINMGTCSELRANNRSITFTQQQINDFAQELKIYFDLEKESGEQVLQNNLDEQTFYYQLYLLDSDLASYYLDLRFIKNIIRASEKLSFLNLYDMLLKRALITEFSVVHNQNKSPDYLDWIDTTYATFYDRHIRRFFTHPPFGLLSTCEKTGTYFIEQRMKAVNVLTKHLQKIPRQVRLAILQRNREKSRNQTTQQQLPKKTTD